LIIAEVRQTLNAEVICGSEWLDREVGSVCGADLMSDVLAFPRDKTLLLTGLTNIQVIRTADMSDLIGIVFVRGKRPNKELIRLALYKQLPLLVTCLPMYESCGLLYCSEVQC
jgi:predicted transcriptional regulator